MQRTNQGWRPSSTKENNRDPSESTREFVRNALEPLQTLLYAQAEAVKLLAQNQAKEPQASQVASDVAHLEKFMLSKFADQEKFFNTVADDFEKLVAKQNELNDKALKAAFDASSQVVQTAQVFNDRASLKAEASSDARMKDMTDRLSLVSEGLTDKINGQDKSITELKTQRQSTQDSRNVTGVTIGHLLTACSIVIAVIMLIAVVVLAIVFQHH